MTQAICLRCGESKMGALTQCFNCSFDPKSPEEKARSIVLSDHHMNATSLENAAKAIQAGEAIPIPDDLIASYVKTIETTPDPRGAGCFAAGFLLSLGVLGTAAVASVVAFIGGRWITGLYRLGAGAGLAYVMQFCLQVFFLWERREYEGRDRKRRWVLLNALPVATVVAALVYFACQGRF